MELSSVKHTREACEEQVALIEHTAGRVACAFNNIRIHLLRYRNTFSTVNNLPPEILSHIFRFASCSGAVRHTNMDLASVCSHWRAVSLNDPVMWSFLDATANFDYAELAIPRAQSVPLSILGSPDVNTPSQLLGLAKVHLHRTYALQLTGPTDVLSALSGMPAPLLEDLYLHNSSRLGNPPADLTLRILPISPSISACSVLTNPPGSSKSSL